MGGRPLCWDRDDPVGEAGLTSLSGLKEGPGGPGGPWGPGGPLGPTPGSPCEQKTQLYQGACPHIGSGRRTVQAPHTHPGYHSPSRPWGPRLLGSLGSPVASVPLEDRGQAAWSGEGPAPCPRPSHHQYMALCPQSSAEQTGAGPWGGGDVMGAAGGHHRPQRCEPSRERRPTGVTTVSRAHRLEGSTLPVTRVLWGHRGQESRLCTARVSGLRSSGLNCPQCD